MDDITVKEELDVNINEETNIIVHIKSEIEITQDDNEPTNPFENVQLEIKKETYPPMYDKSHSCSNVMVSLPSSSKDLNTEVTRNTEQGVIEMDDSNCHLKVKEETAMGEESLVSYDYPNFDEGSMDSNEATALGNVEACLQDDINIKSESEIGLEEHDKADYMQVKNESDLTVTETHLISNKVINTTSTITNPQDGLIQSQTTKTLVMEILPMCHTGSVPLSKMGNPEEILPTTYYSNEESDHMFQLNSITGNVLSLEQEAYGLLKAKKKTKTNTSIIKLHACPKCPKIVKRGYELKRHLAIHDTIEKRAMGVIKGRKTRKENQQKKLKLMQAYESSKNTEKEEKKMEKKGRRLKRDLKKEMKVKTELKEELNDKNDLKKELKVKSELKKELKIKKEMKEVLIKQEDVKKEGYQCTCGQIFQRRSRMETCLRSHDMFSETISKFPCMTCMKQFKDKEELSLHRKRLHRKKFPCKFCPTDYNTKKELFKHLQIHQKVQLMEYKVISEVMRGKQKLRCFMCSKSYVELSELKCHVMEDHREPYICPHCSGTFHKIIDFGNHTKTFHPEIEGQSVLDVLEAFSKLVKAWKCEECGLQFHEADKLALHQIEKHSPDLKADPQLQCPDCRRVFISQKGLTSHRRIHHSTDSTEEKETVEKGVMCVECRKICKDMDALTSHMRLHSLDRKYPCKYCDFRFATPEKRKAHAEIHIGDLKYVCFICEYQCSSENRLKQHKMSLKHANMKEFLLTGKPLIEEGQSTSKKSENKRRRKEKEVKKESENDSDSKEEVPCDICGDKFPSESAMLEHKQTHPFIEFPNEDKPTRIFFK